MEKFEECFHKAKNAAEDAGDIAKNIAGDIVNRAKDLTEEGSKVRELAKNAKEQTAAVSLGVKEKVQGVLQDTKAGKEIRSGITELEALPEIKGSIIYRMELETVLNYLNGLLLIINDNRIDDDSVIEEIKIVMDKLQPTAEPQETEEQQAIESIKVIALNACGRALEILNPAEGEN